MSRGPSPLTPEAVEAIAAAGVCQQQVEAAEVVLERRRDSRRRAILVARAADAPWQAIADGMGELTRQAVQQIAKPKPKR